jgi:hypothetical protein
MDHAIIIQAGRNACKKSRQGSQGAANAVKAFAASLCFSLHSLPHPL